jgi:hypothetical protein
MSISGDGDIRAVGNSMTCVDATAPAGCLLTGSFVTTGYNYVLGNYVHDVGSTAPSTSSKFFHSVYISDGSDHLEFGWNTIANNQGNRAVQVYTSTVVQFDMKIHDNFVNGSRGVGLLFNGLDATQGPISVYNNVVYHAGTGPDFPDGPNVPECVEFSNINAGSLNFYNNTLVDCGSEGAGVNPFGGIGFDSNFLGQVVMKNNIVSVLSPEAYFSSGPQSPGALSCSNNLFFGKGIPPTSCNTSSVNADPQFVNGTSNFHLQSTSPAIGAGVNISGLLTDFDGVSRPQAVNGNFAIGAYEFNTGAAPPPPSGCDVNGDGVVNVADVQLEVNMALGISSCTNPSGVCTVVSVQRVVNAALGGTCVTP